MSEAPSQAWAFYREVARKRVLRTICGVVGIAKAMNGRGERAVPFWSFRSRVERIIKTVPGYAGLEPDEVSWEESCSEWLPDLTKEGINVGVNLSGKRAAGSDIEAERVQQSVQNVIHYPQ